jgi:alpha-mannosidase
LLLEADKWSALPSRDNRAESDEAWWKLAFVQSHDVYTGSHPTVVFDETMARLSDIERYASVSLKSCASSFATPVSPAGPAEITMIALNGLPWQRDAIVETSMPAEAQLGEIAAVRDGDTDLPFDVVGDRLRFRTTFSGVSAKRIALRLSPQKRAEAAAGTATEADRDRHTGGIIANEFLRVEADLVHGLQIFPVATEGRPIGLDLTLQEDRGSFQIEDLRAAEVSSKVGIRSVEEPRTTALGSSITLRGQFPRLWTGHADPLQWEATCRLYPGKRQVDLTMKVAWRGEASRIRLAVSTGFDSSTGIFEIPFGAVRRTPYHSRRTAKGEWPAHRWVAVEEGGSGVALINTGNASAEVTGGCIRTTLLRAPVIEYAGMVPDETSSQHGHHIFEFSIRPYDGSWSGADAIRLGQEMNVPVICYAHRTAALDEAEGLLEVDASTVVLSGVKLPEDGARNEVVVRLYEAVGKPVRAHLKMRGAQNAWQSDMLEQKRESIEVEGEMVAIDLLPFEIKTIRIGRHT